MTKKIYKSAQGKSVDLGTIMLRNEHVRAVGNMNVNARGDRLDSNNRVLETKPRQIQKQHARTTNVSQGQVQTSNIKAKQQKILDDAETESLQFLDSVEAPPVEARTAPPAQDEIASGKIPTGGLAAAIARSREIKQELEKNPKLRAQETGLKKI